MQWNIIILFLFYVKNGSATTARVCNNSSFSSFLDSALAEYDRDAGPSAPVVAVLTLNLRYATVLEAESSMKILLDVYLTWTEPRLTWNSSEWDCDVVHIAQERLWTPDVTVLNSGATFGPSTDSLPSKLSSEGQLISVTRIDVTVPMAMDLVDWPSDRQTCVLVIGSMTLPSEYLFLGTKPDEKKENLITKFEDWTVDASDMKLDTIEDVESTRSVVAVKVMMRRRAPAHSVANGAVFVAILVELLAAMLIPPDARASLCACAAFTASFWLTSSLVRLPHGASTPITLSLMGAACVAAAVACGCSAAVARVSRLRVAPPRPVRAILTAVSGFCKLTPLESSSAEASSGAWAAVAKLLDRCLSAALLLALFVMLCLYAFR